MNWGPSQNQQPNPTSTPTAPAATRFPAPYSPVEGQHQQPHNFSQPPPNILQARPSRSMEGGPPASKYQRPSYSPTNFPNPGSFQISPSQDSRCSQSRLATPDQRSASTGQYSGSRFVHTDKSDTQDLLWYVIYRN